jgi:hypothetical protein
VKLDECEARQWLTAAAAARAEVINVVNSFFQEKLVGVPTIKAYIESLRDLTEK